MYPKLTLKSNCFEALPTCVQIGPFKHEQLNAFPCPQEALVHYKIS